MWRKEEPKAQAVPDISTGTKISTSAPAPSASTPRDISAASPISSRATACISQGIKIHGEVTGSEDLFVDGEVDGKLDLGNASVTIGPNGRVKADVTAREIIVRGRVDGKITARERVHLWSSGQVIGEVQSDRLSIEDGAVLRGKVDTGKRQEKAKDAFQAAPRGPAQKSEPAAIQANPAAD